MTNRHIGKYEIERLHLRPLSAMFSYIQHCEGARFYIEGTKIEPSQGIIVTECNLAAKGQGRLFRPGNHTATITVEGDFPNEELERMASEFTQESFGYEEADRKEKELIKNMRAKAGLDPI